MNAFPGNETIRLTMAQAVVKFLQAQHSECDGNIRRLIPAMFGYLRPRQRVRHGASA
jgi:3D-(3,5/4)-trihydroxycyclohexane-1,2-dione acylhydrolase (decyclizing)